MCQLPFEINKSCSNRLHVHCSDHSIHIFAMGFILFFNDGCRLKKHQGATESLYLKIQQHQKQYQNVRLTVDNINSTEFSLLQLILYDILSLAISNHLCLLHQVSSLPWVYHCIYLKKFATQLFIKASTGHCCCPPFALPCPSFPLMGSSLSPLH
jgi:hypothetical protein